MATDWLLQGVAALAWSWNAGASWGLPATAALAAVALIGYLFGQRTRSIEQAAQKAEQRMEMERASSAAHQLEWIADTLRRELADHHGRLVAFRRQLIEAQSSQNEQAWRELIRQAEQMLPPTTELTERLSVAYDAMRQRAGTLQTLSQSRTDPHTGAANAQALAENLAAFLAAARRGGFTFSAVLVGVDGATGDVDADRSTGKSQLSRVARLLRASMRETDFVARYSDDELLVLIPNIRLAGACSISERWQRRAARELAIDVRCGVAEYQDGDDAKSLQARTDAALYCARIAGGKRQYIHTGAQLLEYRPTGSRPLAGEDAAEERSAHGPFAESPHGAVAADLAAGELTVREEAMAAGG